MHSCVREIVPNYAIDSRLNRSMTSSSLFSEAKRYIPGGVNSPVRAFRNVGGEPFFVSRAKGSHGMPMPGHSLPENIGFHAR